MVSSMSHFMMRGLVVVNEGMTEGTEYRDAYYKIIDVLNGIGSRDHAICLVGLRGTGKTVLLNQIKKSSAKYGIKQNEILHLELKAVHNGVAISRDEIDINGVNSIKDELPTLLEVEEQFNKIASKKQIKLLIIEEATLCKDLILDGKWFIDKMTSRGTKVLMTGTESATFLLANDNSLYTRLILIDVSYIPFGEYCRVKKLKLDTYEDKRLAMDEYIKHGSILDSDIQINEKYIESAVGINLALSIIHADEEEFIGSEHNIKGLVEGILKYIKLLGEKINLDGINSAISFFDYEQTSILVDAIDKMTHENYLRMTKTDKELRSEQLEYMDRLFCSMGMIYSLTIKPLREYLDSVESADVYLIHSMLYKMGESIVEKLRRDKDIEKLPWDSIKELIEKTESTLYGNILQNVIALQFIKDREAKVELPKQLTYYDKSFMAERTGTMDLLCKLRLPVRVDGINKAAGIDLVVEDEDIVTLIKIENSTVADEHQIQWLNNEDVNDYLEKEILRGRKVEKKVYYLGETKMVGDISYENIADVLIEHYESSGKQSI